MFSHTVAVLEKLRQTIANGGFPDGKLPSARQLCLRFGIGRGAMAVIVKTLEKEGVLLRTSARKFAIRSPHVKLSASRRILIVTHPYHRCGWGGTLQFQRPVLAREAAHNANMEAEIVVRAFSNLSYEHFQALLRREYGGVLFLELYHPGSVRELLKHRIPVVVSSPETAADIPCCRLDYRDVGRRGAYELIRAGHRRVGLVTGSAEQFIFDEMLRGFRGALAEESVPFAPELVAELDGKYGSPEDEKALAELFARPDRPTGILVARSNRLMAIETFCEAKGWKIPDDLSVIGFDNPAWPGIEAGNLTMLNDASQEIDAEAVRMLGRWIASGERPPDSIRNAVLTCRGSVTLPR